MKKIFFSIAVVVIATIAINVNGYCNSVEDDETIEIDPFTDFNVNGIDYHGKPKGTTVTLCPGAGEDCVVVLNVNGHKMKYVGTKTIGGPDIDIRK